MTMHENSLAAYKSLNLRKAQKKVLAVFVRYKKFSLTDRWVSETLGWDINRVTGRIRELTDMEVLEEAGKKKGNYGVMVRVSRIKPMETLF